MDSKADRIIVSKSEEQVAIHKRSVCASTTKEREKLAPEFAEE